MGFPRQEYWSGLPSPSPGIGLRSPAFKAHQFNLGTSQVVLMVKNPAANAGDTGDSSLIPGSGQSPGGRNGNPLQNSCLENPMDRRAWWATVHGVAEKGTCLSMRAHTHTCTHTHTHRHTHTEFNLRWFHLIASAGIFFHVRSHLQVLAGHFFDGHQSPAV